MWINFHSNVYNVEKSIYQKHFEQQFTGKYFERWFILCGFACMRNQEKVCFKIELPSMSCLSFWYLFMTYVKFFDSIHWLSHAIKDKQIFVEFQPCNHTFEFFWMTWPDRQIRKLLYTKTYLQQQKNAHWKLYTVHTK